jgi:hypothetical protein
VDYIESDLHLRSTLAILLAVCERALEKLQSPGAPVAHELVVDLERVVERTRNELAAWDRSAAAS